MSKVKAMLLPQAEKARDFIKSLSGRKIFVIYHDDCDGIASGALLVKFLSKGNTVLSASVRNVPRVTEDLMDEILKEAPYAAILIDFAENVDKSAKQFIENGIKCLVIDHHPPRKYIFPGGAVYSNPRLDNASMPASSFVYDILDSISSRKQDLWISAAGTIADFGSKERPDLVKQCIKLYPDLFEYKGTDNPSLFETSFGKLVKAISSAPMWGSYKGAEFALKCVLSCESPQEFTPGKNKDLALLFKNYETIESDIRKWVELFEKNHNTKGRVKYMVIDSKYSIKSTISTIVSAKDKKSVIILIQEENGEMHMSLRNQSGKYDLNRIIQDASVGLDARGGGHPKASGAVISKEHFDSFLDKITGLINGQKEDTKNIRVHQKT